ncbi:MAG: L-fucose:H+ symporter permease [Kordiimonadaceae bacterium]|jgi:MFS transporter, FHS family, L-fucose permease|nr:L-fucose:H+ symporter permease [Kordiimonadaceae bacterium]MBT6031512.1 L-fucose:H+ symporter permease [Kordiimonadaceae bacterium]
MSEEISGADSAKIAVVEKRYLIPFILLTSMFFAWGIANNMTDTLLAAFKKIMSMSDFETTFVQYAFYGAYFCFALPAAMFIRKYSYKTGILIGLAMFIIGALSFYPASQSMQYIHFLLALYVLAGGLSFLETSANPYIVALGDPSTGTQRLNLAQSFNPIGSMTGILLSQIFILSNLNSADEDQRAQMGPEQLEAIQQAELSAVMGPYVGVAIVLFILWIIIAKTKMPEASDEAHNTKIIPSFGRLLAKKNYRTALLALFCSVGAQICLWSFTIRYVMLEMNLNEADAADYYLASLALFLISRFICTWLMNYITPGRLMAYLCLTASALTLVVIFVGGTLGVYALVATSGCMALTFPTIYALGLRGLGEDTKIGGAGLIMMIIGGAVLTGIQGIISDNYGYHLSFFIPTIAFLVIANYGRLNVKAEIH